MDKNNTKEFDLKEIINPFIRKWFWFVISVLLLSAFAIFYIKSTAPVYKIQTSILIKDARKMSSASGDFGVLQSLGAIPNMGTNSIENELEIFESKAIVEDVLKEHSFQTPFFAKQNFYDLELYGKTNPYIINVISEKNDVEIPKKPITIKEVKGKIILSSEEWQKEVITALNKTISLPFANLIITKNPNFVSSKKIEYNEMFFRYYDFETSVINFQEALKVDLVDKDATVINLAVSFPNRDKAKDFLNSLVRQYNMYAINDKNIESKRTKDFIDNRILLISQELGDVETQKEKYKSSNKIIDLPTEGRINLQLKEQTRSKVLDLNTQIEINNILDNFLKSKGQSDILPVNIGLDNEAAAKNIQEYNALVLKRNKLLENATIDNPLVKELENDIREIKSALNEGLDKNRTSLQISRDRVLSELGNSEDNIAKIPSQEKLFRSIERQQQIKENLYLLLLQKREEAAISMEITAEKARVIDKAYVLKKPVAPKKLMILGVAVVIGMLVPFCIIYLLELLSRKIIGRKDIERYSRIPVIGEIPRLRKSENHLIQINDLSPMAEAFRIMVTNLKFLLNNKISAKKIMVTSTIKGEGKTFISINLGLVLASSGKKVLIIGSDIRNPQLQRYKPEMKMVKGLTEFLYGELNDPKLITFPSEFHPNCDFIYSGGIPPNPADLLENGRYRKLIDMLGNDYDYIIMDTAPLMLVTDSYIIADIADATVYITRSEYSEKEFIEYADSAVETNKIKNVCFVLNDISSENLGYGNKYGYGYHADNKKWWQFKK